MVSEPPSSALRAAPKKRFGGYSAAASMPPVSVRRGRARRCCRRGEARDGVEQDDDVLAALHQALGALEGELGDARVVAAGRSKVEEMTSPRTERRMSVTSSGRSPTAGP